MKSIHEPFNSLSEFIIQPNTLFDKEHFTLEDFKRTDEINMSFLLAFKKAHSQFRGQLILSFSSISRKPTNYKRGFSVLESHRKLVKRHLMNVPSYLYKDA